MSITFAPAGMLDELFVARCEESYLPWVSAPMPYAEAHKIAKAHSAGCSSDLCRDYGADVDPAQPAPEVNMGNTNAKTILDVLGLPAGNPSREPLTPEPYELAGELPAEDFLGRVLMAQAVAPADAGVPVHSDGNSHDMGRRAGYIQARLVELHTLAQWCRDRGRAVVWH